jgi:hypothetical protein
MKKILLLCLAVSLAVCLIAVTSAIASGKAETVNGWVSDSKCGAKGAGASHAECAKKCVGAGEHAVIVNDKDQSIVNVDNPDTLKDHLGHHVAVTGSMNGDAMHVDSVKMLAQSGGDKGSMNDMH